MAAAKHYRRARKDLDALATPAKRTIHPQYPAKPTDDHADDDATFIPDVGSPTAVAAR